MYFLWNLLFIIKRVKKIGAVSLPDGVFSEPWNADLVHQTVVSMQSNARTPIAHAKDRSEVSGGGRKPWRQKGTGRARHGSIRSPIWVGGGVTHGPTNQKNYKKKINKKMRAKALFAVLSQKFRDGEILFIDTISVNEARTKNAAEILRALSSVKGFEEIVGRNTLFVLPEIDNETQRSFRNIPKILFISAKNINPVMLLENKYIVLVNPTKTSEVFTEKLA